MTWRKSSYSGNTPHDCVEVADNLPGPIRIRDSKRPGTGVGPAIVSGTVPWTTFLSALRGGTLAWVRG
ncbi:DUF397 domain-containing protein [Streptomyces sp. AV19]|uniref:DUF397 domain-containing protein n=1 Tax=Streptomyces sp. AV19 TaxID=2793068 RepID=UPI0018FE2459|nr:DUF397 domain-containing protein [Streptomyces sp. AV19]MBH1936767.1 DUF397 domain-containing protein [Streptomyces sp. AV19]MDG4532822.1 DUF397 domain-containing protein [Streptomyces sp. AV19]